MTIWGHFLITYLQVTLYKNFPLVKVNGSALWIAQLMGWFPFLRLCFGPYVSGQILEREMMLRSKKLVTFATSHGSIWGGRKKESRKEVSFFSVSLSIWSAHVIIDLTYSVIFLSISVNFWPFFALFSTK